MIRILSAPAYLATKFEAFNDRGSDYRSSHDIEAIVYILDNRTTIVPEVGKAHLSIKAFLHEEFSKIIHNLLLEEILSAHIHPIQIDERYPIVLDKLNQILNQ